MHVRKRSVQSERYKFILTTRPKDKQEVYDLLLDPDESDDLSQELADVRLELDKNLGDWIAANYLEKGKTQPAELSDEEIEHLRKIGYTFAGIGKEERKKLNGPIAIAVSERGRLYVSDFYHNQIKVLTPEGKVLKTVGSLISESHADIGEFMEPRGLTFDAEGNLIVADSGNRRLQILDRRLEPVGVITTTARGMPARLREPLGVVQDSEGRIWACDAKQNRLFVFDAGGELLKTFGGKGPGKGQFDTPTALALGPDGLVYVADWGNFRIQSFDFENGYRNSINVPQWRPKGRSVEPAITFDDRGDLYVTDPEHGRILRFTEGRLSGKLQPEEDPLLEPSGLAFAEDGTLYVTDFETNRIRSFTREEFQDLRRPKRRPRPPRKPAGAKPPPPGKKPASN
jgi:sugar lactone lactonase YvrE